MKTMLLALTASAALVGVAAPAANAARGMEVAISDEDAMVNGTVGDREFAYKTAENLNATRMRILVQWSRVSDAHQRTAVVGPGLQLGPSEQAAIDLRRRSTAYAPLELAGPAPAYAHGQPPHRRRTPEPAAYAKS